MLFLLGLGGTMAAISSIEIKILLGIAAAAIFYFQTKELFTLSTALLNLTLIWSVNFFFTPAWYLVLVLTFVLSFLIFRSTYSDSLLALTGSLILVEVTWATLFLPVHFFIAAVIGFSVFYLIYNLTNLYFERKITAKKIYFHAGIILSVLLVSLLTSSWQP